MFAAAVPMVMLSCLLCAAIIWLCAALSLTQALLGVCIIPYLYILYISYLAMRCRVLWWVAEEYLVGLVLLDRIYLGS